MKLYLAANGPVHKVKYYMASRNGLRETHLASFCGCNQRPSAQYSFLRSLPRAV